MAEYRKIEDIREVLFRYAHNEHSKAFSKFLMSEIERKNKPDVVERSKIDKAFSEIEKLVTESMREALCSEENYRIGLRKAMEIIERNIVE